MKRATYLTVLTEEKIPLGVVRASALNKPVLGTVTYRDFCNEEEVRRAPYLEVISVIDHHKTSLKTLNPPLAIIGDVQSTNTLLAEIAFAINDRFPKREGSYFVDPKREYLEYFFFLHAILDDTDLLTKVTSRDLQCAANLLNRLKSLEIGKQVIIIDPFEADKSLLDHPEMTPFFEKITKEKQALVNEAFKSNLKRLFTDVKEQNGCCRISQTKMFAANREAFKQREEEMRKVFIEEAKKVWQQKQQIDLHIHMMSTIGNDFEGKDELWFWIPGTSDSKRHLAAFLSSFQKEKTKNFELAVKDKDWKRLFEEHLGKTEQQEAIDQPLAILFFEAGTLNSRKAKISPHLPRNY